MNMQTLLLWVMVVHAHGAPDILEGLYTTRALCEAQAAAIRQQALANSHEQLYVACWPETVVR